MCAPPPLLRSLLGFFAFDRVTGHRFFNSIPLLLQVAREGWLVLSINYRLAPGARFPAQLEDCKRALAWVHRYARQYGELHTRLYNTKHVWKVVRPAASGR